MGELDNNGLDSCSCDLVLPSRCWLTRVGHFATFSRLPTAPIRCVCLALIHPGGAGGILKDKSRIRRSRQPAGGAANVSEKAAPYARTSRRSRSKQAHARSRCPRRWLLMDEAWIRPGRHPGLGDKHDAPSEECCVPYRSIIGARPAIRRHLRDCGRLPRRRHDASLDSNNHTFEMHDSAPRIGLEITRPS